MVANTLHHNSYFHPSFSKDRIGYYVLTVQFNDLQLSYSIFEPSGNRIIAIGTINLAKEKENKIPDRAIEILLNEVDWINNSFKEVNVIIENQFSTLVPKALFNKNEAETYLKINHHLDENIDVDFDELKSTGSINIFCLNKTFFESIENLWPSSKMHHISSVLIESISNNYKNKTDNNTIFVNLRASAFDMVYFKDGKLNFYNLFKFKTQEDFIYFLLATIEQLKLNPEEVKLILMGEIKEGSEYFDIAFKYIRHINIAEENNSFTYPESFDKTAHHRQYSLLNVSQCEL